MSLPKVANLKGLQDYTRALKENYIKKIDADEMIKKAVAEAGHAKFEKVETLPEVAEAVENVMYLLYNSETEHYDIYAKIGEKLEQLDDTSINLDDYVQKEEGKELIATEKIAKLDGIAEGATKVEQGTKEGTLLINGEEVTLYEVATEAEIQELINELVGTTSSEESA